MARKDHISALDGLRAVAALLIVWVHIPQGVLWGWMDRVSRGLPLGYLGVDIFFVLSGFLITRILLVDRQQGTPVAYFLMRRFLRIFPIYYLTIVVLAIVDPQPALAWCAAYLSNFYFAIHHDHHPLRHTWSLAVEEHYYLVWPFVVYLLSVRHSRAFLAWGVLPLAVVGAVGLIVLDHPSLPAEPLIYRGSMFRAFSLGLGALCAYHEDRLRDRSWLAVALASCSLIVGCLGVYVIHDGMLFRWHSLIRMVSYAMFSVAVVGITIMQSHSRFPLLTVLRSGPMRFVGRISYGLYLYHFPIYHVFGLVGQGGDGTANAPAVVLAVATTFGVATTSYFAIEKPLLKLKDRYRSNVKGDTIDGLPPRVERFSPARAVTLKTG